MESEQSVPYMAAFGHSAGDDQPNHPRNGWVEVRMLFRLAEGIPALPYDMPVEITPNLGDPHGRPYLDIGDRMSPAEELTVSSMWTHSVCKFRILADRPVPNDDHFLATIDVADRIWEGIQGATELRNQASSRVDSYPARFFAEIVARWSVTLDCRQCRSDAVVRTATALERGLDVFSIMQMASLGVPFEPLANLNHTQRALWLKEHTLDGELHKDHGLEIASFNDPRIPKLQRLEDDGTDREGEISFGIEVLNAVSYELEVGPFFSHIRDAGRAHYLNDAHSSAIVGAAQACEFLLDLVLTYMEWWDRTPIPEVARKLKDGVVKRVQSHYVKLGGTWDVNTSRILSRWRLEVADKRNRIAHGGRPALFDEAEAAVDCTLQLFEHFVAISRSEAARGRYPGLLGMLRNTATVDATRKQRDASDLYHNRSSGLRDSFRSFSALVNRERWIAIGNPLLPGMDHAHNLVVVDRAIDELDWWVYDPETHYAIRAVPPALPVELYVDTRNSYRSIMLEDLSSQAFTLRLDHILSPASGEDWIDAQELPLSSPIRPT